MDIKVSLAIGKSFFLLYQRRYLKNFENGMVCRQNGSEIGEFVILLDGG